MTEPNGTRPQPVLAGHLVIYPDAIAFRREGGQDGDVVVRPIIPVAREQLMDLLSPGEGGILAPVMNGQLPKMNREQRRAAMAMAKGGTSGR
jgi:hypothetical protein